MALFCFLLTGSKLLLHWVESGLGSTRFNLLLSVQFSDLLFLFVNLFCSAWSLLTDQKVTVSVIFDSSFLDRINLHVFRANVILELGDLSLQVFYHLLTSFEDLLFWIAIWVGAMELSLLFLKFELHFLHVFLHAFNFEVVAFKLRLDLTLWASLLLKILSQLDEHLIFLKFDRIALSSQLGGFRVKLLLFASMSV